MSADSSQLFERARRVIPGGVNSPVRAFRAVGGHPPFIQSASGPFITDVSGKRYLDYVGSWGPMILGHAHPEVLKAVCDVAQGGTSFGAPTEAEIRLAEMVVDLVPSVEMVRMVSSGTEATMSAIRLARAATKRDDIIKFDGGYHGHSDGLLVKAGSGAATFGEPDSPGVPADYARHTITLPYNDGSAVDAYLEQNGHNVAAIIVEPVAGNMGCVPPIPGYLERLREACTRHGVVLIFDEVMTGFRVALGGAQAHYGVTPDLTTMGKVIGGGLPVGAFGGKRELMELISPAGPVYQAGTLSGNPLAMAAGIKTLELISVPGFFEELSAKVAFLVDGIVGIAAKADVAIAASRVGGMFGLFFREGPVHNFAQAQGSDLTRFNAWFQGMLARGQYLAPSQFEAGFVSAAHTQAHLEQTLAAATEVLSGLK
ncbi:MAG: glutamate-1-semialdehyde-2,1-aminomutase [Alphaproteobacteria bacterium CG_4_10_14_0_2_um_filter_63_37]|nr:MAG: glutamate-1-semialdehyde-2,1-aminomutase [Proteobacteria bacterium CG1_02_64_396]PJA23881.1 MAG: glutamate-1-semialdehyde-2,1-aminomutase [Alphaproteobacteria bacterium CG_4_10_14_0_2_um_filter_63_37]